MIFICEDVKHHVIRLPSQSFGMSVRTMHIFKTFV